MPPACRGVAYAKALGNGASEPALFEVVNGLCVGFELLFVAGGGFFEYVAQGGLLLALCFGAGAVLRAGAVIRHLHAVLGGQVLHGFDKAQAVVLHQEIDGITAFAAAKAVVELLAGADGKRGGFFAMKGAKAREVGACFFELHIAPHDLNHIDAVE